ncbi:MAG TPA: hypothetical protein VIK84_01335 [Haloplasmataceae bacterium]
MIKNKYITYIENYIKKSTPIEFIFLSNRYNEIVDEMEKQSIKLKDKSEYNIIYAAYTLFYTALYYHRMAKQNDSYQPYYILIGDYISGYAVEILYKKKMFLVLEVFSHQIKEILLNIINDSNEDHLLENLMNALKD